MLEATVWIVISSWLALSTMATVEEDISQLKQTVESLTRQVMLQQLFIEEKIRSDGDSGLKDIRMTISGTKPYYGQSYTPNIAAIHEHANYKYTVGLGELNMVMNGVEFRTRHNDHRMKMPSKISGAYHLTEFIPFPDVPPAVLRKHTVDGQVVEMRKWFKAWRDQDYSVLDYRPYFKAVMCYMEGAWTTDTRHLEEPFHSERHHLDASSWFDLQEKIRFMSYTGGKSNLENYAYLPTTIMNMHNGTPEFAQWNYRIVCHPIAEDLPTRVFMPVDDVKVRVEKRMSLPAYINSRAARFTLNNRVYPRQQKPHDRKYREGLLDHIMKQIPGKDNYIARSTDEAFGDNVYDLSSTNKTLLNTAYYHRYYKTDNKGAMGVRNKKRGFNDAQLFVAETNQPRISPVSVTECKNERKYKILNGHKHFYNEKVCHTYTKRVSYAIPLEVIYLTPLATWNPHAFEYREAHDKHLVTDHLRNGAFTADKAYNGTSNVLYYHTPAEFFTAPKAHNDAADTTKGVAGVLDRHGNVRRVVASGTRITLPNIPGIGTLRTRYPIMPIHAEGSAIYKELKALEELVLHQSTFKSLLPEHHTTSSIHSDAEFRMQYTHTDGTHTHEIFVPHDDYLMLIQGHPIHVTSEVSNGHDHELVLKYNSSVSRNIAYSYTSCDGHADCWDGHGHRVSLLHAAIGSSALTSSVNQHINHQQSSTKTPPSTTHSSS